MYRLRFDMRAPGCSPEQVARLYETALEMARYVDEQGDCQGIAISEHHAADDGFLPSPLMMAAAVAAVTERTPIAIAAALLPLYDPVRLAEDMIVLDHLSRGRTIFTLGIGYRPEEYDLHGVEYRRRGALADEKLATLLDHLRAASACKDALRVTPAPFTAGGPMITWGGTTPKAAQRAARFGLGFLSQSFDPTLGPAYEQACADAGTEPFFCYLPSADAPNSVFVNDDLEQGWADVGEALLADAVPYYSWNAAAGLAEKTVSLDAAGTIEELRAANGSHRVVTVDEAAGLISKFGALGLQPLCGGLDPELAWTYLRRVVEEAVPAASST